MTHNILALHVLNQAIQSLVIDWLMFVVLVIANITVTVTVTVNQGLCQPVNLCTWSVQYHHLQ